MATQPRATVEETFGHLTPLWDEMCRRAGLTRSSQDHHELEQDWQRFSDAVSVAFRGEAARRSSAPPLKITERGVWF